MTIDHVYVVVVTYKKIFWFRKALCFLTVPPNFQYQNEQNLLRQPGAFLHWKCLENATLVDYNSFSFWYWKLGGKVRRTACIKTPRKLWTDKGRRGQRHQTTGGKAQRCKKRRTWRMGFLYQVLILGQIGILALILGILQWFQVFYAGLRISIMTMTLFSWTANKRLL